MPEIFEKEELMALIEQGYSIRQLAKHFTLGPSTIRYYVKKFSLTLKRGKYGKLSEELRDKKYNEPGSRKCACGETDPSKFYGNKRFVCSKCHNQYTLQAGRDKKKYIVDRLGGSCKSCGYKRSLAGLDVHHLDPSKKDPNFSSHRGWSIERINKELDSCILLCRCCHAEVHSGELIIGV